jgi:hypothetical protein
LGPTELKPDLGVFQTVDRAGCKFLVFRSKDSIAIVVDPSRVKKVCLILGEFNTRRSAKQREQPSLVREQGLTINSVFDVISVSRIFTHLDIAGGGSQLSA